MRLQNRVLELIRERDHLARELDAAVAEIDRLREHLRDGDGRDLRARHPAGMSATTRGALQAAYEELAVYPAIVAMHEEQAERAEAEAARLRVALERIVSLAPPTTGANGATEIAREALNGGEG